MIEKLKKFVFVRNLLNTEPVFFHNIGNFDIL